MKTDKRLLKIASFVKAGSSVCDVGCDHAYLSAFLYLRGDLKSVTATDINEKPLENAEKTLEKYNASGVKLMLTDGLDGVGREDADTVIIAGLGGDVISGIIDRAPFLRDSTVSLILEPMTSVGTLRDYLAQNGFDILREEAVTQNGKVYSVMEARFDGKRRELSCLERRIGALTGKSEEDKVYIKRQIKLCREYLSNLRKAKDKENEIISVQNVIKELGEIIGEE